MECERARRLASLDLDGQLSEVGHASLRAHAARCAACAAYAVDLDALTRAIRTAPLEQPAVAQELSRRRSTMRTFRLAAAAAAVMLAAGLGSLAGSLDHSAEEARIAASAPSDRMFLNALVLPRAHVLPGSLSRAIAL
jgi:predicted anti-sigma-YlaC factor YlaD